MGKTEGKPEETCRNSKCYFPQTQKKSSLVYSAGRIHHKYLIDRKDNIHPSGDTLLFNRKSNLVITTVGNKGVSREMTHTQPLFGSWAVFL